jgi:MarR family transcriptional regulator, transcriptional regulator for hemolysin
MQPLENDLFYALHDVARMLRTKFDQRARAYGMTRAQAVILHRLQRQPGLSQNEMASICEVEPITIARLVDRLEAAGMLKRCPDPNDRRIRRLKLLPAAEPVLKWIDEYKQLVRDDLSEGISPEDWDAALRVLMHMKNKLTAEGAFARPGAAMGE